MSAAARQGFRLFCFSRWAIFAIVVVLPEPLIPAKRIMKGCFIFRVDFISSMKFGGLIRIDLIDSFSSFWRSTSLRIFPISFVPSDSFIDWTAS